ncbi:DUF2975 domain-containing protein [Paraurantiacibacter namhicola]|uniref:DUF2975 domain-containing protein n=1 Tax=Paraurantiacibacter namhicola TaxID=645517 RepID=A0A1C7D4Y5_9SPHN|nr:DUF2975 domain-containing protein [Paraurantiacibacter namhicola]ANU06514.1 hypothetical protein A6F65_00187 [Paraurantiacibacter namhicola]
MAKLTSDPLLAIAKAIVWFLLGIVAFAGFFVALGAVTMLLYGTGLFPDIQQPDLPRSMGFAAAGLLAAIAGLLYLGWRFFRHMLGIVNSVAEGDPFAPANADRLTGMAWLMLAINVLVLPIAGLGVWMAKTLGEDPGTVDASVDLGGIVLILTLFILARVFRHGTALREDLEGTV